MTELSTDDELFLANKINRDIYIEQDWEFLRKNQTGVTDSNGEIPVPIDFEKFMQNYSKEETKDEGSLPDTCVVFISGNPYKIIPAGSKNLYVGDAVCYYDSLTRTIKFPTSVGVGANYEFDYKYIPVDLELTDSPLFSYNVHQIIFYGMLIDDEIIQKVEKARSFMNVNSAMYNKYLSKLKLIDASLFFN